METLEMSELRTTLDEALHLPVRSGEMSALVLRHGTMELRLFRPGADDAQTPHDRDEVYIVVAGHAVLLRGTTASPWEEPSLIDEGRERIDMAAGDAAVVPAGTPHRFVEVSADFITWTVFWGPEGGDVP